MNDFNPNDIGNINNNIFGLPYDTNSANIVFVPVPWDVTVSYNDGTAHAPEAIFNASFQVDLFDPIKKDAWKTGYAMTNIPKEIISKNKKLKQLSSSIIESLASGENISTSVIQKKLNIVNQGCSELNEWVAKETKKYISKNKLVGIIGGDHSSPLGFIKSLSGKHSDFGILQIDAHADLRDAYEGFTYSHASIMFNALKIPQVKKLVQLGIRDYCEDEHNLIQKNKKRIKTFFDRDINGKKFKGISWEKICKEIISELPDKIYISFDIDGLDPKLCPCTGTPVPGGFDIHEIFYLFEMLVSSKKKIIGFDLCETGISKNEWDANVAARVLFKLANIMSKSNNL
ncbi:MAG TPA: agmatinase family protein [Bacteroidales bacterium]|nr:agmatinase family protein [Bacteroidales bacterium]HPS16934.1 agmatinase family protein [Bacteroidales bacterium]